MQNKTVHRKKKFVPAAFKFMVAVGSMAGTVGIWNTLANKELLQASAQNTTINNTSATVEAPLPTVAPLLTVDWNSQTASVVQPTAAVRDVTITTSSQPALTTTSNSSGVPTFNSPAPITTTQSSKRP